MKRIIEYPFHLGDLIGGTAHLDNGEFGAYMRLLIAQIQSPTRELPNDAETLRRFARCTPKAWATLWPLIRDKFPETERGTLSNKRVENTIASIIHRSDVARANVLKKHKTGETAVKPQKDGRPANHITMDISKDISPPTPEGGEGKEGDGLVDLLPTIEDLKRSPLTTAYLVGDKLFSFDQFFERFWEIYPKIRDKGHKGKAREQLIIAIKKGGKNETDWNARAERIATGVKRYAAYCKRTDEKNADAFRWLRDQGFERDYTEQAGTGRNQGYSLEAVHDQALADRTGRPEGREERLSRLGLHDDPSND